MARGGALFGPSSGGCVTHSTEHPVRLILVDQLLKDGVGHHLGYNLALAKAAVEAGMKACIAGHRKLDPELTMGLRILPIFRTDWRADPPRILARSQAALRFLERVSESRFAGDLQKLGSLTSQDDLVYAQMIAPRHFVSWLGWLSSLDSPPFLILQLGYQPHRFRTGSVERAMGKLTRSMRDRLAFVTDSEKLTGPFSEILGEPIHHLPHVVDQAFLRRPFLEKSSTDTVFFAPGNARREKGFGDLLAAANQLAEKGRLEGIRLRVQCHQPDSFCAALLGGESRSNAKVEFISRPLSDGEYRKQFEGADVILMPYHLDCYELRTSGVFCEARTAGKPVLTTRGSWAGDRIAHKGGGWLVEEKNPTELAGRMLEAARDLGDQLVRAEELQEESIREFSPAFSIEKLVNIAISGRCAS